MLAKIICGKCVNDAMKAKGVQSLASAPFMMRGDMNEDYVLIGTCPRGHKNAFTVTKPKFAIIFDMGMYAFIDGYHREAVASFASALERLYEFFIRVVCRHKGIDEQAVELTWKNVASQSERQLGAFCFLYLQAFQKPPQILKQKSIEFRNNVIHKGDLPTRDATAKFFEEVFNLSLALIIDMRTNCRSAAQSAQYAEWMPKHKKYNKIIDNENLGVTASRGMLPYIGTDAEEAKFLAMSFAEKLEWHKIADHRYLFPETTLIAPTP